MSQRPEAMTKAEMVYRVVKEWILSGDFKPGESISISLTAQKLGISEIPVREAIRRLESQRLVEFIPHVGARVAQLDPSELEELLEVRVELESLATARAAETLTGEQLAVLRDLLRRMEEAAAAGDRGGYGRLNVEFHHTIYRFSPYQQVAAMIFELQQRTERTRWVFVMDPFRVEESMAEHWAILDALERHDPGEVRELTRAHKRRAFQALLRRVREQMHSSSGQRAAASASEEKGEAEHEFRQQQAPAGGLPDRRPGRQGIGQGSHPDRGDPHQGHGPGGPGDVSARRRGD